MCEKERVGGLLASFGGSGGSHVLEGHSGNAYLQLGNGRSYAGHVFDCFVLWLCLEVYDEDSCDSHWGQLRVLVLYRDAQEAEEESADNYPVLVLCCGGSNRSGGVLPTKLR